MYVPNPFIQDENKRTQIYYLRFRNETHSEEPNVSRFYLSAVNHSRRNVLRGGAVA